MYVVCLSRLASSAQQACIRDGPVCGHFSLLGAGGWPLIATLNSRLAPHTSPSWYQPTQEETEVRLLNNWTEVTKLGWEGAGSKSLSVYT